MTDDDKPTSTISLAAERQRWERDFAQERADLLQELRDIGVEEPELAATVQRVMFVEWATFHRRSDARIPWHRPRRAGRCRIDGTRYTKKMNRTKLLEAAEHFNRQRRTAKQRGIEWRIDFWDWYRIWQDSGHLSERGRCKGSYQMCRSGDIGPYASSTVRIDRMEVNASEAQQTKRRMRQASLTICSS
jgi:hypothetical protein